MSMSKVFDSIKDLIMRGIPQQKTEFTLPKTKDYSVILEYIINAQVAVSPDVAIQRAIHLVELHARVQPELYKNFNQEQRFLLETLRELDIFTGSHPDYYTSCVAQKISRVKTHIGYTVLCKHLAYEKKPEVIAQQQGLVSELQKDDMLLQELTALLSNCAEQENTFLSFWLDTEPGAYDPLGEVVRTKKFAQSGLLSKLNYSTIACGLKELFVLGSSAFVSVFAAAGLYFAIKSLITACCSFAWFQILFALGALGMCIMQVIYMPDTYRFLKYILKAYALMHRKLKAVAQFVKNIEHIEKLLAEKNWYPELAQRLKIQISPELEKLQTILSTSTFAQKESLLCHWGRITVAYRIMIEHKDKLLAVYTALGELDYFASLAQLLTARDVSYCKAEFLEHTMPVFELIDASNPFLNATATPNTIKLGVIDYNRAIIITGPNARGKTTILRTAGINALLAHSLGIAMAQQCKLTPLVILTSINTQDTLAGNQSLFQAGVSRMASISNAITTEKYNLLLIDEPFVGTRKELAESIAYTCLEQLGTANNTLLLVTSHLESVKSLKDTYPEFFANYFVSAKYKFEQGTDYTQENYNDVALSIVKEKMGEEFFVRVNSSLKSLAH